MLQIYNNIPQTWCRGIGLVVSAMLVVI